MNSFPILVALARKCSSFIRSADVIARYGGEEFAIVLPYTGAEGAMKCAEHIRKRVENHAFSCSAPHVQKKVTASLGVATFPWDASDVEELIRKADLALYQAKKQGKNCVHVYANGLELRQ